MRNIILLFSLISLLVSCDGGSDSSKSSFTSEGYYNNSEPEYIEQVVTRYCTTCGGSGQVMTAYGPSNCPGCTAYGRPAQYQETVMVPNPNYKRGSSNISFQHKNSCNIRSHNCPAGVDSNSDGWCDNCESNGYKCHMVDHVGNK